MIWFFLAMVKVCEVLEDCVGACLKGFASCQCALASILSQNIVRIARNSDFFGHADGGRCWGGRRAVAGAGGLVLTVCARSALVTRVLFSVLEFDGFGAALHPRVSFGFAWGRSVHRLRRRRQVYPFR